MQREFKKWWLLTHVMEEYSYKRNNDKHEQNCRNKRRNEL